MKKILFISFLALLLIMSFFKRGKGDLERASEVIFSKLSESPRAVEVFSVKDRGAVET